MSNWREQLSEIMGCAYNTCPEHGSQKQLEFIQTEIIEKLIADIPAKFNHKECANGQSEICDECVSALSNQYLKQQLKDKWLNN